MKASHIFLRLIMPLLVAVMACNAPIVGTTPAPTPKPPAPVTSLMDNLKKRVASGEWTKEQGLVTTLKFVAGQSSSADINPKGQKILSTEGTGVIIAAAAYIANGPDQATRAELQRLLNLIFPDPKNLERYSKPAAHGNTPGNMHLARASLQIDCSALWSGGFPAGTPATCFEYRSVTVAGQDYRLFSPTNLPADPRDALTDSIMGAIPIAVTRFAGLSHYYRMPPADLVYTLLPGGTGLEDAQAATWMPTPGSNCEIAIFPSVATYNASQVQQIIAHELFHCYQMENFRAQTQADGSDWWVEGEAEFFGNVAFPTVNAEYEYAPQFDANSPTESLVDMSYENFVFFQFMEDANHNDDLIIDLMRQMPMAPAGGRAAQIHALANANTLDIADLFQKFGRAYLDAKIEDSGGGYVPLSPWLPPAEVVDHSFHAHFPVGDFVVERELLAFPENTVATLADSPDPSVADSTRPRPTTGGWAPMPQTMRGCNQRELVWLATNTNGDGSDANIDLSADVQNQSVRCDPCLVGRWQLDETSYWSAFETFATAVNVPGTSAQKTLTLEGIDGEDPVVQFMADGSAIETFSGFDVHYTEQLINGRRTATGDAHIRIDGQTTFDWSTTDSPTTLNIGQIYSQPTYNNSLNLTQNGVRISVPVNMPPFPAFVGGPYQCSGPSLQITASLPGVGGGTGGSTSVNIQYFKMP